MRINVEELNSPTLALTTYGGIALTQLMRMALISRGDLGQRFSMDTKFDRTVFLLWYLMNAEEFFGHQRFWLKVPCWELLQRPSPEYGQFTEAPLTTLQAAMWFALPLPKILDLTSPEDRLKVELIVAAWPKHNNAIPPIPVSAAAKALALMPDSSLPADENCQPITVFMRTLWRFRPDVQAVFPLDSEDSRKGFLHWFETNAPQEMNMSQLLQKTEQRLPLSDDNNQETDFRIPEYDRTDAMKQFGINVIGSAQGGSGISRQGQTTVVAAEAAGLPVCMVDHGISCTDPVKTRTPDKIIATEPRYFLNVSAYNVDAFPNFVGKLTLQQIDRGYNVYYGNWEYADYPLTSSHVLNAFDEAWAPSRFTYSTWEKALSCPVQHVPMAVTVTESRKLNREFFNLPEQSFVFLFVFDFWSWIDRKNPKGCVKAFQQAFPDGHEPAALVIKTKNVHHHDEHASQLWDELKALCDEDPRIRIIDVDMDDHTLHDLMRSCDAYLSLHRAEGFGFSIAEAMLLGMPVIATNYSGNTEFNLPDNSLLVQCQTVPVSPECTRKLGIQTTWAEPDVEHAAYQMKRLFKDSALGRELSEAGKRFIQAHYSPIVIGEKLSQHVAKIFRAVQS